MSADSVQPTLDGDVPDYIQQEEHRAVDAPSTATIKADIDRSECWCTDCDKRITIGEREYGHAKDCEHYCRRDE